MSLSAAAGLSVVVCDWKQKMRGMHHASGAFLARIIRLLASSLLLLLSGSLITILYPSITSPFQNAQLQVENRFPSQPLHFTGPRTQWQPILFDFRHGLLRILSYWILADDDDRGVATLIDFFSRRRQAPFPFKPNGNT